jgi:uncharacterized protein (DUF736 family)
MIPVKERKQMSNYIVVGGGWCGTSSTGDAFVRLRFKSPIPAEITLTMWKNKHKESPKQPDYLVMAAVDEKEKAESPDKLF